MVCGAEPAERPLAPAVPVPRPHVSPPLPAPLSSTTYPSGGACRWCERRRSAGRCPEGARWCRGQPASLQPMPFPSRCAPALRRARPPASLCSFLNNIVPPAGSTNPCYWRRHHQLLWGGGDLLVPPPPPCPLSARLISAEMEEIANNKRNEKRPGAVGGGEAPRRAQPIGAKTKRRTMKLAPAGRCACLCAGRGPHPASGAGLMAAPRASPRLASADHIHPPGCWPLAALTGSPPSTCCS